MDQTRKKLNAFCSEINWFFSFKTLYENIGKQV
jgi:hypothetical protein